MAEIYTNLGVVGLRLAGEYDNATQYHKMDVVAKSGNSFAALGDVKGIDPPNTAYWQLIADSASTVEAANRAEAAASAIEALRAELQQQIDWIPTLIAESKQTVYENISQVAGIVRGNTVEQNARMFPIGDQIIIPWKDMDDPNHNTDATAYAVPLNIVKHEMVELQSGVQVPGVFLQWHYATPYGVQFDAAEPTNPDANIAQCGYNRWSQSGVRQYLNSAGAPNTWWTAQSAYDVAPAQHATKHGFMAGFDADFLAAIKPVKVQTATNTVTDGGVTDVTYDTFFLPSLEEMYAVPQIAGVEGSYYPYWKERLGRTTPNDLWSANANPNYIHYALNGQTSSQIICLRSAYRGTSNASLHVHNIGSIYNDGAHYAFRLVPVCVIC